jgi:hypothetical protein
MWTAAWFITVEAVAILGWLGAAFALRLRHLGRLWFTLTIPALLSGGYSWFSYLGFRTPGTEPGWDMIFFALSVSVAAFAAILALPAWFLAEERLGWRARG